MPKSEEGVKAIAVCSLCLFLPSMVLPPLLLFVCLCVCVSGLVIRYSNECHTIIYYFCMALVQTHTRPFDTLTYTRTEDRRKDKQTKEINNEGTKGREREDRKQQKKKKKKQRGTEGHGSMDRCMDGGMGGIDLSHICSSFLSFFFHSPSFSFISFSHSLSLSLSLFVFSLSLPLATATSSVAKSGIQPGTQSRIISVSPLSPPLPSCACLGGVSSLPFTMRTLSNASVTIPAVPFFFFISFLSLT
ncbi:hypothetical protein F5H01DRAFT_31952 [Linnemannia elongata]|nr:hypothetical protein F5H01DRAFT_31952 [Linnemannia elongata]